MNDCINNETLLIFEGIQMACKSEADPLSTNLLSNTLVFDTMAKLYMKCLSVFNGSKTLLLSYGYLKFCILRKIQPKLRLDVRVPFRSEANDIPLEVSFFL